MSVRQIEFGENTSLFLLEAHGLRAAVSNFGAALVSLWHPDGTDLVLGYDRVDGYIEDSQFMGVIVGRYANRIAHSRFELGNKDWQLTRNDGPNHLHGGKIGFGRQHWQADIDDLNSSVRLTCFSPHLDQGYPGNVSATVTYQITGNGRLRLQLNAISDQPTPINLTSHAYFNLAGSGDVLGQDMTLFASHYTPVDDRMIPTGEILPVDGTPFDYRRSHDLNEILDTNFVIDGRVGELRPVAKVTDPLSGRTLSVQATMPGAQLYVGGGHVAGGYSARNAGFCIEPQYFPDSPNQPKFSTPVTDPNHPYSETIEFEIGRKISPPNRN